MASTFGPSALVTPANAVTMARVGLTPVLLAGILASGASWPALALWIALAVGVALAPTLEGADWLTSTVLWGAVVLTVWSGVQYLADARRQAVGLAM